LLNKFFKFIFKKKKKDFRKKKKMDIRELAALIKDDEQKKFQGMDVKMAQPLPMAPSLPSARVMWNNYFLAKFNSLLNNKEEDVAPLAFHYSILPQKLSELYREMGNMDFTLKQMQDKFMSMTNEFVEYAEKAVNEPYLMGLVSEVIDAFSAQKDAINVVREIEMRADVKLTEKDVRTLQSLEQFVKMLTVELEQKKRCVEQAHLDAVQEIRQSFFRSGEPLSESLRTCAELSQVAKTYFEDYKRVLKTLFSSPIDDVRRVAQSIYDSLNALSVLNVINEDGKEENSAAVREAAHVFALHEAAMEMQLLIEKYGLDFTVIHSEKDEQVEQLLALPKDSLAKRVLEQNMVAENLLQTQDAGDDPSQDKMNTALAKSSLLELEKRVKRAVEKVAETEQRAEATRFDEKNAQTQLRAAAENMAQITFAGTDHSVQSISEASDQLHQRKKNRLEAERAVEDARTQLKMAEVEFKHAQDQAHATAHGEFISRLKELADIGRDAFSELELSLSRFRDALATSTETSVKRTEQLQKEQMEQIQKGAASMFQQRTQFWLETVDKLLQPVKAKHEKVKFRLNEKMTLAQSHLFNQKPVLAQKLHAMSTHFDTMGVMETQKFHTQRMQFFLSCLSTE
jgi:hypothetical protein